VKKLKSQIDSKDKLIANHEKKTESLQALLDNLRYDYMKEICHLRDYMFQKEIKHANLEYIDVRFYEASKDIDPKI
jgi:hypothetical protein